VFREKVLESPENPVGTNVKVYAEPTTPAGGGVLAISLV
jgi:hypothetical protein